MAAKVQGEVPPPVVMMGLITGYWLSQAVGVVAKLGVADYLGNGPRTCDELARSVGGDSRTLYRVLRLLASVGVFTQVAPRPRPQGRRHCLGRYWRGRSAVDGQVEEVTR
jgi:hypothetical protein